MHILKTVLIFTLTSLLAASATAAEVHVRVYDYAGLTAREVAELGDGAARILEKGGLGSSWVTCRLGSERIEVPLSCEGPLGPDALILRVVPGNRASRKRHGDGALGFATVMNGGGSHATLFLDRIDGLASRRIASRAQVLVHAAAHELGHLLLGSASHAHIGIMRGNWNRRDLREITRSGLAFNTAERRRMRRNLAERRGERYLYSRSIRQRNSQLSMK